MRQQALIGALMVATAQAQAAPVALSEDELRTTVVGRTIKIDTPLGTPLTVQIGANGIMQGTATGALALYLGSAKDRGRWRVKDGKLCQKWFKWLDAEESCISVKQDGLKIFWRRDDGKTGTAMIEPGPPMLAGATASGLGLPPPPGEPEAAVTEALPHTATPPAIAPRPPEPVARSAAVARPKPPAPVVPRVAPMVLEVPRSQGEPPADLVASEEPQLIEVPRVVARRPPSNIRLAAFAPQRPIAQPAPLAPADDDPFAAETQPMRWAADVNTIAAIEHRWCHADTFGRGPASPRHASTTPVSADDDLEASPNLLAIFYETSYPGELPLHDAACLTAEPALMHVPILPTKLR